MRLAGGIVDAGRRQFRYAGPASPFLYVWGQAAERLRGFAGSGAFPAAHKLDAGSSSSVNELLA